MVPLTSAAVIAPVALLAALIVRLARLAVPEIVLQIVPGITIGPRCSTGRTSTRRSECCRCWDWRSCFCCLV